MLISAFLAIQKARNKEIWIEQVVGE